MKVLPEQSPSIDPTNRRSAAAAEEAAARSAPSSSSSSPHHHRVSNKHRRALELRAAEHSKYHQTAAGSATGAARSTRRRRIVEQGASSGAGRSSGTGTGSSGKDVAGGTSATAHGPPYTSHSRPGGRVLRQNDRVHPTADVPSKTVSKKGLSRRGTTEGKNGNGSSRHHHARSHTASTADGVVAAQAPPSPGMVSSSKANGSSASTPRGGGVSFRRLRRGGQGNSSNTSSSGNNSNPTVDAGAANAEYDELRRSKKHTTSTPRTDVSTPASSSGSPRHSGEAKTPAGVRGRKDLRSPGVKKSPVATTNVQDQAAIAAAAAAAQQEGGDNVPIPDFITQTDKYGNASTPRSADAIVGARRQHPAGPEPHIHVTSDGKAVDDQGRELHPHEIERRHANEEGDGAGDNDKDGIDVDPCDALLESLRMMCCCLVPEDSAAAATASGTTTKTVRGSTSSSGKAPSSSVVSKGRSQYSTRESTQQIMYEDAAAENQVKLLPAHHPDDLGKKCLVLDLDETLVHSSFRAVPGADFVIPVQIEDVVHFVYVMKRPGVDEFLIEMAKHYEVVIYTASLNKYADPLLDLLDPHKTIRTRLFRESCVYYEGNYVKDLSLLDRDLSQSIIIDNSPSSYIFHPENAIDCTSFIDDPNDRELDQIGAFLKGIRNIDDVRGISNMWRDWPHLNNVEGLVYDSDDDEQ